MIVQNTALRVLTELNLQNVFFPNETETEKDAHCKRIINFLAFRAGRKDSQSWLNRMDGEKPVPQILGDMVHMLNWDRPLDPYHLSPYDRVFTDMAIVEGATALDLTSPDKRSYAVMMYLRAVKQTIEMFKKQYDLRKDNAAELVIPPLAPQLLEMESPEAEADVRAIPAFSG